MVGLVQELVIHRAERHIYKWREHFELVQTVWRRQELQYSKFTLDCWVQ